MMKSRVLISGLGGSMFPYLHHQLEDFYEIFYIDSDESLLQIYKDFKIFKAPLAKSRAYEDFLSNLIEELNIDLYIPLIDEEILKSSKLDKKYKELAVLTPTFQFSQMCLNKFDLMLELSKHNISDIKTALGNQSIDRLKPPYFIKPVVGRGSRGVLKIENKELLELYLEESDRGLDDWLVQEYCEGVEYTVGALVNKKNKILSIGSRKVIQKRGVTISAVTVTNDQINKKVNEIVETFEPKGPFNVQLFITKDDEIKIFEINPRFSTTSIMSYKGGINEVKLLMDNINNDNKIDIKYPEEGVYLKRTWNSNFYK